MDKYYNYIKWFVLSSAAGAWILFTNPRLDAILFIGALMGIKVVRDNLFKKTGVEYRKDY